jgi:tRNA pseudouridine synthase 10
VTVEDPVLKLSLEILKERPLCDSCLGRLFARMGYALENWERGYAIKTLLHMRLVSELRRGADVMEHLKSLARAHKPTRRFLASIGVHVQEEQCYVCGGLLAGVEKYAREAAVRLGGIEFDTFVVGTTLPKEVLERESEIVKKYLITAGESIKHEVNRRIGRELLRLLSGKRVDKLRPNVVVRINIATGEISIARNPVLVGGRYLKLSRGISQAQKLGSVRATLLEKLSYIRELFGGVEHVVHAAGREDSDARMLGAGRPLVVEVKQPARYKAEVAPLVDDDIIFAPEGPVTRDEIRRLKERSRVSVKLYRALVHSERPLAEEELARLSELSGRIVTQYTPRRIRRRSPRRKRTRMVYEVAWRRVSGHVFELYVRCQGGLYVKEFVHGDGGRTTPSVAGVLGSGLEVVELDVLAVE